MSNGTRFDERYIGKNCGQRKVMAYIKMSSLHPHGRGEEN